MQLAQTVRQMEDKVTRTHDCVSMGIKHMLREGEDVLTRVEAAAMNTSKSVEAHWNALHTYVRQDFVNAYPDAPNLYPDPFNSYPPIQNPYPEVNNPYQDTPNPPYPEGHNPYTGPPGPFPGPPSVRLLLIAVISCLHHKGALVVVITPPHPKNPPARSTHPASRVKFCNEIPPVQDLRK